ncbi:MAG: RHS repeat-associated core domain-containing protein [Flavobacteriales bacterium]|nr:MAG: RHS repeat-associated core domain-containing protein [Flavobacteriales bacterium]
MTDGTYRTAVETVPHFEDEHHPQDITISGKNFQFSVPRAGLKENLVISVHEIIDMGPPNTRGGSTIWTYTFMADPTLPPVTYYEHDHLGNTRVTYTPVVTDCGGVGGPPSIDYTLEHVADYYPYGKILREYDGVPEKYLSTHHERDAETGLDYRGARYYDSDVARFVSLDPLAAKYVNWSPYCYVLGNPISLIDPTGAESEDVGPGNDNRSKFERKFDKWKERNSTNLVGMDQQQIYETFRNSRNILGQRRGDKNWFRSHEAQTQNSDATNWDITTSNRTQVLRGQGGTGVGSLNIVQNLGTSQGTLTVRYNMYGIPDRMQIVDVASGNTLFDTATNTRSDANGAVLRRDGSGTRINFNLGQGNTQVQVLINGGVAPAGVITNFRYALRVNPADGQQSITDYNAVP